MCAVIKNAHCPAVEIAKMDIAVITDEFLKAHLKVVRGIYRRHGGNDDAGRSPQMSETLKRKLFRTFSSKVTTG